MNLISTTRKIMESWVGTLIICSLLASWFYASIVNTQRRSEVLRENQIAACERVNLLRTESNDIGIAVQAFLTIAAEGRDNLAVIEADLEATAVHTELAAEYRALKETINQLALVDCRSIVGDG